MIHAPPMGFDKTRTESVVRKKFGVTVVGIQRPNEDFQHAGPDSCAREGDLLLVSGAPQLVEKIAGTARPVKA